MVLLALYGLSHRAFPCVEHVSLGFVESGCRAPPPRSTYLLVLHCLLWCARVVLSLWEGFLVFFSFTESAAAQKPVVRR